MKLWSILVSLSVFALMVHSVLITNEGQDEEANKSLMAVSGALNHIRDPSTDQKNENVDHIKNNRRYVVVKDLTPIESETERNKESNAVQTDKAILPIQTPSLDIHGRKIDLSNSTDTAEVKRSAKVIERTNRRSIEDNQVIEIIANGGTNSGTALTNGKLIYSASGAIVEAPYLQSSNGKSLTISDSGASSVTPIAAVKFNLIGVDSSTSSGPHINTYTGADNYTLTQQLSFSHNNEVISFDTYWDGSSWKSSYVGSNYQIYKQSNQLQFRYATGVAAGSSIGFTNAFAIGSDGKTSFNRAIRLPTSGGVASDLYDYSETSGNCAVSASDGTYNVSSTTIKGQRINTQVTLTITKFTGNISGFISYILISTSCLSSGFVPSTSSTWAVPIYSPDDATGFLQWNGTTLVLRTESYSLFPVGSGVGLGGDVSISFIA